ncbi:MAG: class I SAM-dependent methyltransferase [Acidobacteria bacterium]|nr:class I SAM-dependent methyltransferase [Acidobacteriota bacterium]
MPDSLINAWRSHADNWITWARAPGHDSYWRFHREQFLDLVPTSGRCTLDIGCGEGRVGRDLSARGHNVIGVDACADLARACTSHADGCPAAVGDAAHLPIRDSGADLAVGFLVFQDLDDLDGAIGESARVLCRGGRLHLAIVHPINSAGRFDPGRDWPPPFVIDGGYTRPFRYADEIERNGLKMVFHGQHRPLREYTRSLSGSGFVIETLEEITDPSDRDKWARIPMFLHIVARLDTNGV